MYQLRTLIAALCTAALLAACGGSGSSPATGGGTRLLAQATAAEPLAFPGVRANYAILANADGSFTVADVRNGGAPMVVPASARLRFADASLSFDVNGTAGQAYRLYKAAFNRTPDPAGLGFWIDAMNRGATLEQVAAGFVDSKEYWSIYGDYLDVGQIVARYYQNILGRAGEPAGIDFWTHILDSGAATLAQVLAGFSESAENKTVVLPAIQSGVPYRESGVAYVPAAEAVADVVVDTGQATSLDAAVLGVADGAPLAWAFSTRPAGSVASLAGPASAHPSFVPDQPGRYEITLSAGSGATARLSKVTVLALWKPADGAVPASGNFAYFDSQTGDPIGLGEPILYTPKDAVWNVFASGASLYVKLMAQEWWMLRFNGRWGQARLEAGKYIDLRRWSFSDPGLDVQHQGLFCASLTGWVAIDSVAYDGDTLTAIDLRFEQHCEGAGPALHGRIRWNKNDEVLPPGPVAVPSGLWQPPQGATPESGNYVYLQSMQGDQVGLGRTYLYTPPAGMSAFAQAPRPVDGYGAGVRVDVFGDTNWDGQFVAMNGLEQLQPGYYANLRRFPFSNPAFGGLEVSGNFIACNQVAGWFAVDKITYVQGEVSELDLRFEQQCEGASAPLYGKVHWVAPQR
jgi:hypothetical protein